MMPFVRHGPFFGVDKERAAADKHELVVFAFPFCDGTCAHCWSADTALGGVAPLEWHRRFWPRINPSKLKEVRVTGGEPLLHRDLGSIIAEMRTCLGADVPISIFTGGRQIVSVAEGEKGVSETSRKIVAAGLVHRNVTIHLSADEHHIGSLDRCLARIDGVSDSRRGEGLLATAAKNFIAACDRLASGSGNGFKGGKLKIHAEAGRLDHHRRVIHKWMDDETWKRVVISSEGLISAGAAVKLEKTIKLQPSEKASLFLIPGAEFNPKPVAGKGQPYRFLDGPGCAYLNASASAKSGVVIYGWWNVINKVFCAGSVDEAIKTFLE